MRLPCILLPALALLACTDEPSLPDAVESFRVTFVGQNDRGSPESPRVFSMDSLNPDEFTIDIQALRGGEPYPFEGWVLLDVQPEVVSCGQVSPQSVRLQGGVAKNVKVSVYRAYCTVRLVATDVGYVPAADPANSRCQNDIDDDGDGYIDLPKLGAKKPGNGMQYGDNGCAMASDDSEEGGTGASGASDPIYYRCPTMADIQTPILGKTGNESPLKTCRVMIDRGWLLVTRVGVDGLYVTDFEGVKWDAGKQNWSFAPEELSYDSMFVYNYSTPVNLQEGDCLTQVDGTVEEFYGFTEMNKPVWKKGDFAFCAAKARAAGLTDCPTREEDRDSAAGKLCRQRIEQLANSPVDLTRLMLKDHQGIDKSVWDLPVEVLAERFESGIVKLSTLKPADCTTSDCTVKMFTEARFCDADSDGEINFSHEDEKDCSNDCGDHTGCIVMETYRQYNQWSVHFMDGANAEQEVSIVTAGAIPTFDPIAASKKDPQGMVIGEVVGTLRHLVFARPPWIIEARRPSDCPDCKN